MLLNAHRNIKKLKYDIKIVPVCINYDRLFEASYLANEMVSGKFSNTNMMDLTRYIFSMRKGKLGKVFVKYAEPIDLNDYILKHKGNKANIALNLSRDLY